MSVGNGSFYKFSRVYKATVIRRKSFKPPFRNHVTASKLPAFAHQDDYASAGLTAVRVFAHKELPEPSSFSYSAMDHGNQTESIACAFIRQCPVFSRFAFEQVENDGIWSLTGTWRNNDKKKAFMFSATPDMLIQDRKGYLCPVEIKCPYKAWVEGLDLSSDFFKPSHWIQLMAQMLLTEARRGYLCVFMPERGPKPIQTIIWEVRWTRAAENFILTLVDDTYEKINACVVDEDYKKVFRAKTGEKQETKNFIDSQIRSQTSVVYKLNC